MYKVLTDNTNPATLKNIEDLDEHVTSIVRRTYQEILTELHTTRLDMEKLRLEMEELRHQMPPKLRTI
jgi:predicted transcriptional regulator